MAKVTRTSFCYRIVRFFRVSARRKIIAVGLTRDQAMTHCRQPYTSRAGVWFDGFEVMPGYEDYIEGGVLPGAGDPPARFDLPVVWADPIVAGDEVPVPVAGQVDPALVYSRWQAGPAVRGLFGLPAMPDDEGGYWD